ncbi:MAG: glutamate--tRNA ligase family protein, partial [Patescibacteria group bacterium]|nr:glutamate--tRNA ligase family protein [Patescibacteria group bacterium]
FQEALQFPRPVYAHIPLLLGADRTKLSKRHGATAVTEYRTEGYLPEAALNFLALLGWHPEGNEELLSKEDLMRQFSLERVQKSAAVFTVEKLRWLNGEYIKKLSGEELAGRVLGEFAPALKETMGAISVDGVMTTMRTRAKTLRDIERYIRELSLPPAYSKDLLRWKDMSDAEVAASLRESRTLFAAVPEERFTQQTLEDLLMPKALEWGSGDRGKLLWPLRVALSGREKSEGPFELAKDLGKEETLRRLERALEILKEN